MKSINASPSAGDMTSLCAELRDEYTEDRLVELLRGAVEHDRRECAERTKLLALAIRRIFGS